MTSPPPSDLAMTDVPSRLLHPTEPLWRIHRLVRDPSYFSAGSERFDPPPGLRDEYGVCYLSTSEEGAFLETLGRIRPLSETVILERACTEMRVKRSAILADLTHPTVVGQLGIAGDLSAGSDYSLAHEWSASLYEAGFDGIYYAARYDATFESRSVALFGRPGQQDDVFEHPKLADCEPIGDELVARMRVRFAFQVLPPTSLI